MSAIPRTTLASLAQYLNAAPGRRGAVTRTLRQREETAYHPAFDFWRPLRQAVVRDRKTDRNAAALRAAAANAPDPRKKPLFAAAADSWAELCERWSGHSPAHIEAASIELGGLYVKVAPLFAEQDADGRVEVVLVRFAEEELARDVVGAILRIVQRCYPEHDAVYVDVRRKSVSSTRTMRNLSAYDAYLESEAAGLAHLLADAA